jgi:hypothetical protein
MTLIDEPNDDTKDLAPRQRMSESLRRFLDGKSGAKPDPVSNDRAPLTHSQLGPSPDPIPNPVADPAEDLSVDHSTFDDQSARVDGDPHQLDLNALVEPNALPGLADAELLIFADALDDLERVRIATENRVRSLRQMKGLAGSKEEARLQGMVEAICNLEHQAELDLKRVVRTHPLGPWVKRTKGVGEKQGARLLAAIGNPYWHAQQNRPRTVSELWAYTGYHVVPGDPDHSGSGTQSPPVGVAPFRRRGTKANWSSTAKMRAFLVAESCIKKSDSPYRPVYDAGREKYADAVHQVECKRCGPAGKPAQPGSPLSAGHQHARAMRLVSKAILRDLWIEAKALHEAR